MVDEIAGQRLQEDATATGNGTAFDFGAYGYNTAVFQVEGITTATITWEATLDGTNWVNVRVTDMNASAADAAGALTTTADGLYRMNVSGVYKVRARISAYTAGTINVWGRAQA